MRYYAIFAELPLELFNLVKKYKNFYKQFTSSNLVHHPPHITLLTFSENISDILNKVNFQKTYLKISKKSFFYNNPETYTLILEIEENTSLYNLHRQTVEIINQTSNKILYSHILSNWIPHITIGQINDFEIAEKFKHEVLNYEFYVNKLTYCLFEDEQHKVLETKLYD